MKFDFLIVGTGFYGSVLAERISKVLKKTVLIIDKRSHIGGNCFSELCKKTNIEYHKYGTHIFHTSNQKVMDYLSPFMKLNIYRHQVLTKHKNHVYQMPINLETINSLFRKNFSPNEAKKFIELITQKEKILKPENFEEKAISVIGKKLYNAFIKNYTFKQWGMNPKKLPASIFNRLPVRFNYNENYFNHCNWQGIPENGYTEIFEKLLSSKRITTLLKCDYFKNFESLKPKYATIYTGPIDKFFNNKFGKLGWRSLNFKHLIKSTPDYQGTAVMNYADLNYKYTRIHEPRHLHPERKINSKSSLIIEEYPIYNDDEPYYPINDFNSKEALRKYKHLTKTIPNVFFGGRLADYAYYDMDMTISASLQKFEKIKKLYS
jgi:UDP-galactopyranose mutase